ncbi:MFS transporter [Amycolatopsis methanolica]|uniref:Major facilitator superfamily MFS_1 n=1 Tax=Amycolatopsis methanolica 239 TaxID=1068978 RepID=A0A076MZP7_AMYME|nr:MFS transporter [Amycolatopsis methanolica]AIJ26874.1 major facilitator superfamily MFS_1 [Amycolatopsis methanolica 239]
MATTSAVKTGGVLGTACVSTFIVNVNTSAVSILLPSISADLGTSLAVLQWAVTGYMLVGAATIVTSGALGDVFGRRRVFVLGLGLFVVSCVLIALAPGGWMVVVGRVVQGAAGAAILASGLSLLSVVTEGPAQMRSVAYWGAAAAAGAAAGPVVGGVLNEAAGWQGLFWIAAAVAAACVPWTLRTVPESRDPDRPRSIDVPGTLLVACVLAPFVFAMTKGSDWGWWSVPTVVCLAVTALAAIAFPVVEHRMAAPLVDLRLLRNPVLVGATLAILIGAGAIAGLSFLISLYFQDPATFGMSSLLAGLACLPVAALVVAVAPAVTPLAHKFGPRPVIVAGFVLMTAGFAVLAVIRASWSYWAILPSLLGIAVGLGLSNGPASALSTSAVRDEDVGAASGVSNMARYVGGAVLTAVVAGIYSSVAATRTATGGAPADALATGFGRASLALAIFSAAGVLLGMLAARRTHRGVAAERVSATAAVAHTVPVPR